MAYVVTQKEEIANSVDKETLKKVLTSKKVYWSNGSRIKICHLSSNSKEFKSFLSELLKMSSDKYLNIWRRKLFTGRGLPTKQVSTSSQVIDCVKQNASAIGIVSKEIQTDLKVIKL